MRLPCDDIACGSALEKGEVEDFCGSTGFSWSHSDCYKIINKSILHQWLIVVCVLTACVFVGLAADSTVWVTSDCSSYKCRQVTVVGEGVMCYIRSLRLPYYLFVDLL